MNISIIQILSLPWVLIALVFHEYCHAWVSYKLGDPTPESEGRLSLNPLVHIDPIGMIALIIFHFGWAKPVIVNPRFYRNPMKGILWVSLAGPGANFIFAIVLAIILKVFDVLGIWITLNPLLNNFQITFRDFFLLGLYVNLGLGFFNLIPIPPLDGSKVLRYFLRGQIGYYYDRLEPFGFFILIGLLFLGTIGYILSPVMEIAIRILTGY